MDKPKPDTLSAATRDYLKLAWKILLPIAIGIGVVLWMFHREFDGDVWRSIRWDSHVVSCILLGWLFMAGRDFGLSWRFRALTGHQLRWGQAIKVNMLCEFTSCVTPSAVGGSAFGMLYLHREGIELGRATTLMMTTLFLDELLFVVSIPAILLALPYRELFGFGHNAFTAGLQTVFWAVYAVLVMWTMTLFVCIVVKPHAVGRLLAKLFSLRWLRKWKERAEKLGADMEQTGKDLRRRPLRWWLEAFGATALSWSSRYLVVNALFLAFVPGASQLLVFARQFVVWVVLMASPTPGGSGVSEWLFTTYYGDLIQNAGMAIVIALFWRMISYYVYLAVGACIVPGWIRQGLIKKHKQTSKT